MDKFLNIILIIFISICAHKSSDATTIETVTGTTTETGATTTETVTSTTTETGATTTETVTSTATETGATNTATNADTGTTFAATNTGTADPNSVTPPPRVGDTSVQGTSVSVSDNTATSVDASTAADSQATSDAQSITATDAPATTAADTGDTTAASGQVTTQSSDISTNADTGVLTTGQDDVTTGRPTIVADTPVGEDSSETLIVAIVMGTIAGVAIITALLCTVILCLRRPAPIDQLGPPRLFRMHGYRRDYPDRYDRYDDYWDREKIPYRDPRIIGYEAKYPLDVYRMPSYHQPRIY